MGKGLKRKSGTREIVEQKDPKKKISKKIKKEQPIQNLKKEEENSKKNVKSEAKSELSEKSRKKSKLEVPVNQTTINGNLEEMIKCLEQSNRLLLNKLVKIENTMEKTAEKTEKKVKEIKTNWKVFHDEMDQMKNNVIQKSQEIFKENIKNEIKDKFLVLENFLKEKLQIEKDLPKTHKTAKNESPQQLREKTETVIKEEKLLIDNKVGSLTNIKDFNNNKNNNPKDIITFANFDKNNKNNLTNTEKSFSFNQNSFSKKKDYFLDEFEHIIKNKNEKGTNLVKKDSALFINNEGVKNVENPEIDPGAFSLSD
jgi:hypothetical protein